MALPTLARLVMIMRSSMIDELNQQYVKTSFAKGLPFHRVVGMHALRNAALPVMTLTGWETIRALAGYSVVVETVFAWPGIGLTAIQAIDREDLILLQAIVFTVAIVVVCINILMDVILQNHRPPIETGIVQDDLESAPRSSPPHRKRTPAYAQGTGPGTLARQGRVFRHGADGLFGAHGRVRAPSGPRTTRPSRT